MMMCHESLKTMTIELDKKKAMSARILLTVLTVLLLVLPLTDLKAGEKPLQALRVGVLAFGTVSWELELIQTHELAKKRGIDLEIIPLASADASTVALQG